jgi:hypothetical protein
VQVDSSGGSNVSLLSQNSSAAPFDKGKTPSSMEIVVDD